MTDTGRELTPILLALREWGDRHKADAAGPPAIARHAGCGEELRVTLKCAAGHEVAGPDEIELVDGPGPLAPVPA